MALLAGLLVWCGWILSPFLNPLLWGGIIAVAVAPLHHRLTRNIGNRGRLSAILVTLVLLSLIFVPGYFLIRSMVQSVEAISLVLQNNALVLPAPDARTAEWPLVGEAVYNLWVRASENLQGLIMEYSPRLADMGQWLLSTLFQTGLGLLQLILAILASGFFLLYSKGAQRVFLRLADRVMGQNGGEIIYMAEHTIRQVTKGILGVSVIQAVFLAAGFVLAGIPYAGIWAILCLILSVIQLGPAPVVLAIIVYLFTQYSVFIASLWTVYFVLGMFVDNILKPILLGKGAMVPMPVIFLGSLGGFMLTGFEGLFTGAVVLSVGYKLIWLWLDLQNNDAESEALNSTKAGE